MFLQQVYKHSKWLFLVMLIFIIGQLFIGYKHGMVATPFYNYGMYSEVIKVKSSYEVWEIEPNGKVLRGQDFSPQQWDRIMLPVQYYAAINSSNEVYEKDVKRLLAKIHLNVDGEKFVQTCNYQQFEEWYKKYLGAITDQTVSALDIVRRTFEFHSGKLIPTNTVVELAALCP